MNIVLTHEKSVNLHLLDKEIKWLKKLSSGLKTLDDSQFYYGDYVLHSDSNCGTVCCAFGWMPKFVPESGVVWEISDNIHEKQLSVNQFHKETFPTIFNCTISVTDGSMSIRFGGFSLLSFMFLGYGGIDFIWDNVNYTPEKDAMYSRAIATEILKNGNKECESINIDYIERFGNRGYSSSLEQVINRIDYVAKLLELTEPCSKIT